MALEDRARDHEARAARRARTLTVRLEAEPTTLNPLGDAERETLAVVGDSVFESLLRREADGGYTPLLAESWRVIGGIELRFSLRDGVRFQDGRPLTASDVQWSVDRARGGASRTPVVRALLADVASAEVWGPRDFRIMLRRPSSGHVLRGLAALPILPAGHDPGRKPIGTGPYQLARWDRGDRLVLERWSGYWGQAPAIATVELVVVADGAQALVAATRGELDVVPGLPAAYARSRSLSAAPGLVPLRLAPPRFRYLALNAQRAPFDDFRVRQALSLLIDRPRLTREVLRGEWRPIAAPVWPDGPLRGDAPAVPPFDPVRAGLLLEAAGWTDADRDGVRTRGDQRLRVAFLAASGERDAEREMVTQTLRKAGFVVEVRPGEPAYLLGRMKVGDFDLALAEWRGLGDADLCPLFVSRGAWNWGGFSSRAIDGACAALEVAPDARARAAAVPALVASLLVEWPIVPVAAWEPLGVVARRVRGLTVSDGWFRVRDLSLADE